MIKHRGVRSRRQVYKYKAAVKKQIYVSKKQLLGEGSESESWTRLGARRMRIWALAYGNRSTEKELTKRGNCAF